MNILNIITRREEKKCVANLLAKLMKELPVEKISEGRSKVSVNKVTRVLEGIYLNASDFKGQRGVGFFGRAVMANAFKWGLKDAGYSEAFVSMATEGLIVALSKK
jgi:hypothetical protein